MQARACASWKAGPADWHPFIHLPAGFIKTFYNTSINWCYSQEPGPWTAGRRIFSPRGKTLGGSSSINGHIYNRGQRQDFDTWAQIGNRGWGYADVLPYFKRLERRIRRGRGGVSRPRRPADGHQFDWNDPCARPSSPARRASASRAIPTTTARRRKACPTRRGRSTRAGASAPPPRSCDRPCSGPNLHVRTQAHATSIILDGKRATGVRYAAGGRGGAVEEVHARKEVILAGGTYNSPQLLQLSGIGPASLLTSLGIAVKHNLTGVGEGLQDHYAPRSVARVKNIKTINERARGLNLALEVMKWGVTRRGILSLSPTLVYCFWHSGETAESSDLQLTFTPASYKEGEQGKLEDEPGMTVASWQQRPESRGYVRCRSADPFEAPIIQTNYLAEEIDRRVVVAGMRLARRLLASEPLAPYYEREDFPGPGVQTDDEFLAAATQRAQTTFHPGCTCRMGPPSNPLAVVDDQLRVHGLQGLRVVDASIMPRMISANLNASTLMIADKASDMIRGRMALEPTLITATGAPAGRI
jgi:choline dehydrogenase